MKRFVRRNNLFLILLVLYGIFAIFHENGGSFACDEAIYSQVARDSLANDSYLVMRYGDDAWFEKPPLAIWLAMASFYFFGISEEAARFFPGIFSILSAIILYFFGRELFGEKNQKGGIDRGGNLAGFFSGFVFLTSPLIFAYSRTNMLDIPAGMFGALSMLAVWKVFQGRAKWWLVFGASAGLAVMTKSAVGLFPFLALLVLVFVLKKREIFFDRFFAFGMLLFFLIASPWHAFMSLKFGESFWKEYLGFHVVERFFEPVLVFPWEGNSFFAYLELFLERGGVWIFVFAFLLLGIWGVCLFRKKSGNFFEWIFLFVWFLAVTLPFLLASTKLPNYMVLAYFPMALLIGVFLGNIFRAVNLKVLMLVSFLSWLNFISLFRLRASDFAEAHFLFPKILARYFGFGEAGLVVAMFSGFLLSFFVFLYFRKNPRVVFAFSFLIVFLMNALVPFGSYRNEWIRKMGKDLGSLSGGKRIDLYAVTRPEQYSFRWVANFYLPAGSKIKTIGKEQIKSMGSGNNSKENGFCFVEKSFLSEEAGEKAVLRYDEGAVVNCAVR